VPELEETTAEEEERAETAARAAAQRATRMVAWWRDKTTQRQCNEALVEGREEGGVTWMEGHERQSYPLFRFVFSPLCQPLARSAVTAAPGPRR
jgi:hypothetical protein